MCIQLPKIVGVFLIKCTNLFTTQNLNSFSVDSVVLDQLLDNSNNDVMTKHWHFEWVLVFWLSTDKNIATARAKNFINDKQ